MIMEGMKSHDLPLTSWSPRRAGDVILVWDQWHENRTRRAAGVNPTQVQETNAPAWKPAETGFSLPYLLF